MSSVRFFPEINEALEKILSFHAMVKSYKQKASISEYQKISEGLWEKRCKPDESIDTRLSLLSDITKNYALLSHYRDEIKKHSPVLIYAEVLHKALRCLKEDVALYQDAINSSKESENNEEKPTQGELEALEKEKQFCEELKKLIEQIETDFSELEQVKNQLDPIDVVIEESSSTANKI